MGSPPPLHLIHRIPPELQGQRFIGAAITLGLYWKLMDLPVVYEGDFEITRETRIVEALQEVDSEDVNRRLDAMIIEEAETLGWIIVTSRLVQWRLSAGGVALSLRLGPGPPKSPTVDDPGMYAFRKETIPELQASGRLIEDVLRRQRCMSTRSEVADMWCAVIDQHPDEFGHLRANLNNWLDFVRDANVPSNQLTALIAGERFSAAMLFDEWWGYRLQRDPLSLSQTISRLKSR